MKSTTDISETIEEMAEWFKNTDFFQQKLSQVSHKRTQEKKIFEDYANLQSSQKQKLILLCNIDIFLELFNNNITSHSEHIDIWLKDNHFSNTIKKKYIQKKIDELESLNKIVIQTGKDFYWQNNITKEYTIILNDFNKLLEIIILNKYKLMGACLPIYQGINNCRKIDASILTPNEIHDQYKKKIGESFSEIKLPDGEDMLKNLTFYIDKLSVAEFKYMLVFYCTVLILKSIKDINDKYKKIMTCKKPVKTKKNERLSIKYNINTILLVEKFCEKKIIQSKQKNDLINHLKDEKAQKKVMLLKPLKVFLTPFNEMKRDYIFQNTPGFIAAFFHSILIDASGKSFSLSAIEEYLKEKSPGIISSKDTEYINYKEFLKK